MVQAREAYEALWAGAGASDLDFGGKPYLDDLYGRVLLSEEFAHAMSDPASAIVVDLGAGRGSRMARILAALGARVVAVDFFPSFAGVPAALPCLKILSDASMAGLLSGCADVVVSAYVTLKNPAFSARAQRGAYVREAFRLLKPGGVLWAEEPGLDPEDFRGVEGMAEVAGLRCERVYACIREAAPAGATYSGRCGPPACGGGAEAR